MFKEGFITIGDPAPSHYEQQMKWEINSVYKTRAQTVAEMCKNRTLDTLRKDEEAKPLSQEQLDTLKLSHKREISERKVNPPTSSLKIRPLVETIQTTI